MHTPGPWEPVDTKTGGFHVYADSSTHVASWMSLDNARLIAAAPDLLAACKDVVELLEGIDPDHVQGSGPRKMEYAKKAIAKAEGRS